MSRSEIDDTPSVWLMLAVVGDPLTKTVTWSAQGKDAEPAAFTVDGSWASDLAEATTGYMELVTSIYTNYCLFRGLHDDSIQEGDIGISDPTEQDREPNV